jgi:hypothetical protein
LRFDRETKDILAHYVSQEGGVLTMEVIITLKRIREITSPDDWSL